MFDLELESSMEPVFVPSGINVSGFYLEGKNPSCRSSTVNVFVARWLIKSCMKIPADQ